MLLCGIVVGHGAPCTQPKCYLTVSLLPVLIRLSHFLLIYVQETRMTKSSVLELELINTEQQSIIVWLLH